MVYIVRHFNEKDSIYNFCFKVSEHVFAYFIFLTLIAS